LKKPLWRGNREASFRAAFVEQIKGAAQFRYSLGIIMKKPLKLVLRLLAALAIIAIIVVGLKVRRIWNGYHDTKIIANGPFASRFPSLYPDYPEHKKEMERWFLDEIPPGTPREEARRVLGKSFTVDLTSGRLIVIDEVGTAAGGSTTSVRLHFDERGKLVSVEVEQQWAYL
jgi:hypothetical protein